MASLVSTQGLVGSETLIAYGALVSELQIQRRGGGMGAATGKHDEAEGEVLFFRRKAIVVEIVVETGGALGTLALGPWLLL